MAIRLRDLTGAVLGLLALGTTSALANPLQLAFSNVASVLGTGGLPLNYPSGVAVDAKGNVYIADAGAADIVKVQPDGTAAIIPITGPGTPFGFPSYDTFDSAGNLLITDYNNNRIVKVTPGGDASIVSTGSLSLAQPGEVAVDYAGNLFIADAGNNRIVEVPASGSPKVVAITGVGALSSPFGLSVDTSGTLYVADTVNNRVVVVNGVSTGGTAGTVLNIIGQGVNFPLGVTTDNAGTVYISDTNNNRIVKVTPDGIGSQLSTPLLGLNTPHQVARSSSGTLYVADSVDARIVSVEDTAVDFGKVQLGSAIPSNQTLRFTIPPTVTVKAVRILTEGSSSKDFVEGDAAPCIRHGVVVNCSPPINNDCVGATNTLCKVGVDFLPMAPGLRRGAVVLEDGRGHPLISVPLHGWGSAPVAAIYPGSASIVNAGGAYMPGAIQSAFDGAGNHYVAALEAERVYKIPAHGGTPTEVSTAPYEIGPTGVAVDGAGNLFINDGPGDRIVVVTKDGAVNLLTINNLAGSLLFATSLWFDDGGTLYIADYGNGRIVRVDALSVTDTAATGNGAVVPIHGITFASDSLIDATVDSSGNLYAVDAVNKRIVKVDTLGSATALALPGHTLNLPLGVATDMIGNVYITDAGNYGVLQLTPAGIVNQLALTDAPLGRQPFGIVVSPGGNLYIDDFLNGRVVELNVGTGNTLDFPDTDLGSLSTSLSSSVVNIGDLDLAMALAPNYPAIFPEDHATSDLCNGSTVLASGESCTVAAAFAPNSVGVLSSNIVLTDNSLNVSNATQMIPVTGIGVGLSSVVLSPKTLNFGDQIVGTTSAARTVTLTNQGQVTLNFSQIAADGDFSQSNTCGSSLAIGASCSISISFAPSAGGARSGQLSIVSNAPTSPDHVNLSGTGTAPTISVSAASLDFGQTINNQLTSRTLTVTNTGTGTLLIEQVTAPKGFTVNSNCSSLPAGASCQMLIVFHATKVGTTSGELTIKSNAAKGTTRVALTGANLAEPVNGSGAGAIGEDVLAMMAFAAWLRRRMKGRVVH